MLLQHDDSTINIVLVILPLLLVLLRVNIHCRVCKSFVSADNGSNCYKFVSFASDTRLTSRYCLSNAIHCICMGQITCAVCVCVCVRARARSGIGGRISRKRLEIEVWFQWDTNTKWHMTDRLVTRPMMSRDRERSRS